MQLTFNYFTSPHRWRARSGKHTAGFRDGVSVSRYKNLKALVDTGIGYLSLCILFRIRAMNARV